MTGLKGSVGRLPLLADSAESLVDWNQLSSVARRPPQGMQILKFGTRSVVGFFRIKSGEPVILKYYFPKSIIKRLTHGVLGSRALQSWHAAHAFRFVGLPTPAPLYFSEQKSTCGLQLHVALLATRIAPGIPMTDWVERNRRDLERIRSVTIALSEAFTTMARFRISHGDLKASNIMIDDEAGDALSFIDLDGTRILSSPASWVVHWNKDRKRFLANWTHLPEVAAMFDHACPSPADFARQHETRCP
jgi:tRNA A-37 threonylcarbamoyl transferase component Bud32